jgi:hypothetical protein
MFRVQNRSSCASGEYALYREYLSLHVSNTLQMRWRNSIRALALTFQASPFRVISALGPGEVSCTGPEFGDRRGPTKKLLKIACIYSIRYY